MSYYIICWHCCRIFKSKIENFAENKRRDGIVLRKDGTETLILEWKIKILINFSRDLNFIAVWDYEFIVKFYH